jgi:hypothetical protein
MEARPTRLATIAAYRMIVLTLVSQVLTGSPPVNADEASLIRTMPAEVWRESGGSVGRPDANGVFGQNLKGGAFVADNQRRAMDLMLCGIALGNDADLADGWRALEATYQRQEPTGGFGKGTNDNEVESMSFFMSWSNHALWVLMSSPQSAAYKDKISALLPKIELAMDRMMAADAHAALTKANLHSPNRSIIMANAYGFGALVLRKHSAKPKVDGLRQRGKFWIDNVFVKDKLFRSSDGVFAEAGGYDTSYHAVAHLLFQYYQLAFPADVEDGLTKSLMAGQWLMKRIGADGVIDCTYNRRSGPGNASGDKKGSDIGTIAQCLMYWSAAHGRTDGNAVAVGLKGEKNGLPPAIFSPLTVSAVRGRSWTYDLLVTNAGMKELSPAFSLTLTGLPDWLKRDDRYGFTASTGTLRLIGMPPKLDTATVTVTATNEFGTAPPVTFIIITSAK